MSYVPFNMFFNLFRYLRLDGSIMFVFFCIAVAVSSTVDCRAGDSGPSVVQEYSAFGRELEGPEKLKILEMIALVTKNNFEKTQPVRGAYKFVDCFHYAGQIPLKLDELNAGDGEDRSALSGVTIFENGDSLIDAGPNEGYWEIVTGKVRFALDDGSDRYHAIYQVGEESWFIDAGSGVESRLSHTKYSIHWTLAPEYMLQYNTHGQRGEIQGFPVIGTEQHYLSPVVYRRDPDVGKRQTRIVDVRDFFAPGGIYTWELCGRAAKLLQSEGSIKERNTSSSVILVFMKEMPRPLVTVVLNYNENRQTVISHDGGVGFNPVSFSVSHPRGSSSEITIEYRDISGVFFPQEVRLKKYKKIRDEVALNYVRQFSLLDLSMNESIPDLEFGPAAFDVPYAGRLFDEIKGQLFAYDDEVGFVPAADFVYDALRDPNVTTGKAEPKVPQDR